MPQKTKAKNENQTIKQSSNQAIKYLILILASIAIIQIFSVILIASNPQAYNQSRSPRLKAITQKLLNKNKQKYYCEGQIDCMDSSYCGGTSGECISIKWWEKNVGYKYDCLPEPSRLCECVNNKCEKIEEIITPPEEPNTNTANEGVISGTGTINKIDVEGGFYGIISDSGEHYDPINLSQDFQVDGLPVRFEGKIQNDMDSIHMWGTLIEISKIEKAEEAATPPMIEKDDKYYCETQTDCVDGSYCEKTDDGCVNSKWWEENVGYKYDCLPDPSLCKCVNNRCEKSK